MANYKFEETRLQVDTYLRSLSEKLNVYYQPPEKFKMVYPCIRYKTNHVLTSYASGHPYFVRTEFELMFIYQEQTKEVEYIFAKLNETDYCRHLRSYVADGLYHTIFILIKEVNK